MPEYKEFIPTMESNNHDGYLSNYTGEAPVYQPFMIFDGDVESRFRSGIKPSLPEYLSLEFPVQKNIGRYTLYLGDTYIMKEWDFEGLVNGEWIILHSGENPAQESVTLTFDFDPIEVEGIRIKCKSNYGANSWSINELEVFEYVKLKKTLLLSNGQSYYYDQSSWRIVGNDEQDHLDYGMSPEYISTIPPSAWQELSNPIISYYTDDPNKSQVLIETEVEPFTVYDEFGDSMEVLYYTDDKIVDEAELNVIANYSPLDEFEDFEVVTWTDDAESKLDLEVKGIPQPQFVYKIEPENIYGFFRGLIVREKESSIKKGVIRYLLSPNGKQWKTWHNSSFVDIDISEMKNIVKDGLTLETINDLKEEEWETWEHDKMHVGIYLEESVIGEEQAEIRDMAYLGLQPVETTSIENVKLYILNTTSTIDVTFSGSTIEGVIDDEDQGKVQYRILLNGASYFPSDGSFTPLMAAPLNISTTLSNDNILIDEKNTLKIEFQDYWGSVDYWETSFVGTYSGLLFLDEAEEYYTTDVGEILQYLDFGVIVAGQTTLEQKIKLRNTYGYTVENIQIRADQSDFPDGMVAQFGTNNTSFEALDELSLTRRLADGEESEFYIRLSTILGTTSKSSGEFSITVTADKVE